VRTAHTIDEEVQKLLREADEAVTSWNTTATKLDNRVEAPACKRKSC